MAERKGRIKDGLKRFANTRTGRTLAVLGALALPTVPGIAACATDAAPSFPAIVKINPQNTTAFYGFINNPGKNFHPGQTVEINGGISDLNVFFNKGTGPLTFTDANGAQKNADVYLGGLISSKKALPIFVDETTQKGRNTALVIQAEQAAPKDRRLLFELGGQVVKLSKREARDFKSPYGFDVTSAIAIINEQTQTPSPVPTEGPVVTAAAKILFQRKPGTNGTKPDHWELAA